MFLHMSLNFTQGINVTTGGKVLMNETTSLPKSVPRLVVDKVRLLPVIQMFLCIKLSPIKVIHMS